MAIRNEIIFFVHRMADVVRQKYAINIPISDMREIVKQMGGQVVEDYSMTEFSDARIRKTGPYTFEIVVSPFQTEERRNFTIARELGRLFLHMGFKTDDMRWEQQSSIKYYHSEDLNQEICCNEFADAFLMPRREYKSVMEKNTKGNRVNTSKVADYFHVPITAAANRGNRLGYLEW